MNFGFTHKKEQDNKEQDNKDKLETLKLIKNVNIPFQLKQNYNSIIPLKTFTCWHTKELPELMKINYQKMVNCAPRFEHNLFDEIDCYNFIKNNFDNDVLESYNKLIPSSYKSDLWRYCVLYINGGIYFDIKFICVNNFRLIALTEQEYFVRDREPWNGTLNGLISVKPKNEIMLKCINQIVENVKNKYYGRDCLDPTGPGLLGKYFTKGEKEKMELHFANINIKNTLDEWVIIFNNVIILRQYNGYRKEQSKKHYSVLWNERNIYL